MSSKEKYETAKLPMVPIRDVVVFPFQMAAFFIGRESSVNALEAALAADKRIFLATQHDPTIDNPKANDVYQVGTIVGIAASKLDPILFRYFKATPTPPPPKAKELPPTSAEPPPAEKGSSNAIQP